MILTIDHVCRIAKRLPNDANAQSVLKSLSLYGARFGLDQPHRLAQFIAQLMHESAEFRHDREIWGPTPAQKRYDGRIDLGNTAALDGDGKLYMGRTGIQITGKANYAEFRDWCRKMEPKAPDFVAKPDLVNTDPWEGLGPLWYWDTRKLNRFADTGDVEMITKRINGGLNGYADRLDYLTRASLVLLDYGPSDVKRFQSDMGLEHVDGDAGPKTRAALHAALVKKTKGAMARPEVKIAPVVEEKAVAVAPAAIDKPVTQTTGFWERLTTIVGLTGIGGASWLGDWKVILSIAGALIILAVLGLLLHSRIVDAVKRIKAEVEA
jgi:putative chitinase